MYQKIHSLNQSLHVQCRKLWFVGFWSAQSSTASLGIIAFKQVIEFLNLITAYLSLGVASSQVSDGTQEPLPRKCAILGAPDSMGKRCVGIVGDKTHSVVGGSLGVTLCMGGESELACYCLYCRVKLLNCFKYFHWQHTWQSSC